MVSYETSKIFDNEICFKIAIKISNSSKALDKFLNRLSQFLEYFSSYVSYHHLPNLLRVKQAVLHVRTLDRVPIIYAFDVRLWVRFLFFTVRAALYTIHVNIGCSVGQSQGC